MQFQTIIIELIHSCSFLHFKNVFLKIKIFLFFYLLQINIFLVFLNHFDVLISKIIFFKKIIDMFFSMKSYLKSNRDHTIINH